MRTRKSIGTGSEMRFIRRALIFLGLAALVAVVLALADILLLIFGSVLVAVALHAISEPLVTYGRIPQRWSLTLAVLLVISVIATAAPILGPALAVEMRQLYDGIPSAFARTAEMLQLGSFTDVLKGAGAASTLGNMLARFVTWSTTLLGALSSIALVFVGGIYLAADPRLYRQGLVKMFPQSAHPNVVATLDDAGEALRLWLAGQLIAMMLVGVLTGVGLWLVGVPSAFALGLIVGLADFVPYVGPIFAALPVILVASTQDTQTLLWSIGILLIVQQIESNLIVPLLGRRLVSLAPAVGLFSVISMGILLGPLGLLFGFPLAVVIDVAIRRLYVLDGLGEPVEILGKPAEKSHR